MAEDTEILREVWNGRIPVCFNLASNEVSTVEQPEPYFVLLPRNSYLPLVTEKVKRNFQRAVTPERGDEMWFDWDGQPLKWHFPIGLLFDLYGNPESLPWNLTVHFKRFPEEQIIHCPGEDAVESFFMSSLKEADFIKHRGSIMNNMQKKDHRQLWNGLKNDQFDLFWEVNKRLMASGEPFRSIPYRIYQGDQQTYIQEPIKPQSDDDQLVSLGDLIKQHVPHAVAPGSNGSAHHVIVHGVEPPLDTPLQFLSEHFSHPDNFLHIAIVTR
ncbi:autophagy protein 5-like [Corticium candelabrum]|uniref:autophagy protein 5-like n=1 Tax=Corticium candelabrum TaxID=121492 RepID=UPI002E26E9FB|nr:autophagy protein 5-like [Corticium candelabrum]